jgi:hypothetical protein
MDLDRIAIDDAGTAGNIFSGRESTGKQHR